MKRLKKKPLSKRAQKRLQRLRRDPLGRLGLEIARFLEPQGWVVVTVGNAQIRGLEEPGLRKYEFVVHFTGGRRKAERAK